MKKIILTLSLLLCTITIPVKSEAQIEGVKNITVSSVTKNSASITWNTTMSASFYRLKLQNDQGNTLRRWKKLELPKKKIVPSFDLLKENTTYRVAVRACKTKKQCGKWSKYTVFTTDQKKVVEEEEVTSTPMTSFYSACSANIYNCSSFSSSFDAQNTYNYCIQMIGYDIHRLDADNDGLACES